MLRAPDGRFVLIDWPGLGAAPRGSQAAAALETLLRFRAADPAPLVERFLAGWAPDGGRLEGLRVWGVPPGARWRSVAPRRAGGAPGGVGGGGPAAPPRRFASLQMIDAQASGIATE